ncbi:ParB N-terminal domain-containing protein [Streptomyces sp. NBC_01239]|uniref:ParB N-terminal domain-containing protein n=1 Tax=Streptomyces sp. NBC_01239 TaxID=2903792 RepID=UPI0022518909|nr:ParB N-terminal domain-containing protein [Streptomyces sp. NBC_01239]MCX4809039.1 ParB N-terminal domain-containing protein [Streptomyces sp. NBC_01239]MCX4818143.1 ParB N-terminal domain-containing protein [Streptomyces sp. NBC_01239]
MTTDPQTTNDMRELYAVQHAITDAGGALTPAVHKAIDALRETWDRELRRAQAEAYQYRTALQGVAHSAAPAPAPAPAVRPELRDQIAAAIYEHMHPGSYWSDKSMPADWRPTYLNEADAVLSVLPATTNRAAVYAEVADELDAHATQLANVSDDPASSVAKTGARAAIEWRVAAALVRRMAVEAQQQTETPADVQVWPLQRILAEVRCGSQDWTWDEEWTDLDRRHVETGYLAKLEQQIRENGITMPVLIGSDGRLWDGHHRLRIAVRLGIDYVPVEVTQPAVAAAVAAPCLDAREVEADDEGLRAKVDDATSTLRRIRTALRTLKEQGATGQTYHQVITSALAGPRSDEAPAPESEADIVREHVTTVHLIGEQLADVESWLWKRLAEVRAGPTPAVSQPGKEN